MNLNKIPAKIKNIKPWLSWLLVIASFLSIAYFADFRSPNIYDPDSFYHIRHSQIYAEHGLLYSEFPWAQYSVIKDLKSDLWYGLHILLIPFTYFSDLAFGIKAAGFTITFLILLSFYFSLRNLSVAFPALWSSLFIFSSPMILFRMAMTRPHPLSLALSVLLFSYILHGPIWLVLIFSFLSSWIHASLFWFPFLVFSGIALFRIINRQKIDLYKLAALSSGTFIGLFARPHPIANLKLVYIQIIDLYLSKNEVLDKVIGGELTSPRLKEALINMSILAPLIALGMVLLARILYKKIPMPENTRIAILSSLAILLASVLMYTNANRAIDILSAYTIIFCALVTSYVLPRIKDILSVSEKTLKIITISALSLLALGIGSTVINSRDYLAQAKLRDSFNEPARWLEENTREGEIVFHLNWSHFPILFFWNQHNYYINGMDPIFLYKYSPDLYWKIFYMFHEDMGGLTCGSATCGPDQIVPVYSVLTNDFHASYVFVRKIGSPRFREYIESDKNHFQKIYDEGSSIIYKVLPPKPPKNTKK